MGAGMDHIRAMLSDTDTWIRQCVMDRPYMDAVDRTKQLKHETDERYAREAEMTRVEMRPLSARTLRRLLRVTDHAKIAQQRATSLASSPTASVRIKYHNTKIPTIFNPRPDCVIPKRWNENIEKFIKVLN